MLAVRDWVRWRGPPGAAVVVEPRKLPRDDADCQTSTLLALRRSVTFMDDLSVRPPDRRAALSGPHGRRVGVTVPPALPAARCGRRRDRVSLGRGDPSRERGNAAQARLRS